jgi:hypothetical protein
MDCSSADGCDHSLSPLHLHHSCPQGIAVAAPPSLSWLRDQLGGVAVGFSRRFTTSPSSIYLSERHIAHTKLLLFLNLCCWKEIGLDQSDKSWPILEVVGLNEALSIGFFPSFAFHFPCRFVIIGFLITIHFA